MVGGIALLGVVTATLASWLVDRVALGTEAHDQRLTREVTSVREQVARLPTLVEQRDSTRSQRSRPAFRHTPGTARRSG